MAGEFLHTLTPDTLDSMIQTARLHVEMLPQFISMSDMQENPKKFLGPAVKIASLGGLAIGLIGGGIKSYDTLDQGEEGLRAFGGRLRARTLEEGYSKWFTRKGPGELYGDVGPGPHMHRPWVGGIRKISTQDYSSVIKPFHVVTEDEQGNERKRLVEADITWGVMTRNSPNRPSNLSYGEILFRAMAAAKDRTEMAQSVESRCRESIRLILREEGNPESVEGLQILPKLIERCGGYLLEQYGVEIRGVQLGDVAPTEADTLVNGYATKRTREEDEVAIPRAIEEEVIGLGAMRLVVPELRSKENS